MDNEQVMRRYFEEVWGRWNADVLDDLVAPDFVDHDAMPGHGNDREAQRKMVTLMASTSRDTDQRIHQLVACGDAVTVRYDMEWTSVGDFLGVPGTDGKRLTMRGLDLYRLRDWQIVESWHIEDLLGVMQQAGAVPAAGAPNVTPSG